MNFPRKFLEKEKLQKMYYSPLTSHLLIDEAFKVILEDSRHNHWQLIGPVVKKPHEKFMGILLPAKPI
jgi:hypothetical protein